jgi:hypothetical protein
LQKSQGRFYLFFLARAIFPAGIFFNFSESAQTSSHIALLRKAPLLAIDPVAARGGTVRKRQPRWSRVCCRAIGCRQRNHINTAFIHHDLSADVNSIFTISAGRRATNVRQIETSIRIILIMEYLRVP